MVEAGPQAGDGGKSVKTRRERRIGAQSVAWSDRHDIPRFVIPGSALWCSLRNVIGYESVVDHVQ
jgi:hypothetical protein